MHVVPKPLWDAIEACASAQGGIRLVRSVRQFGVVFIPILSDISNPTHRPIPKELGEIASYPKLAHCLEMTLDSLLPGKIRLTGECDIGRLEFADAAGLPQKFFSKLCAAVRDVGPRYLYAEMCIPVVQRPECFTQNFRIVGKIEYFLLNERGESYLDESLAYDLQL